MSVVTRDTCCSRSKKRKSDQACETSRQKEDQEPKKGRTNKHWHQLASARVQTKQTCAGVKWCRALLMSTPPTAWGPLSCGHLRNDVTPERALAVFSCVQQTRLSPVLQEVYALIHTRLAQINSLASVSHWPLLKNTSQSQVDLFFSEVSF